MRTFLIHTLIAVLVLAGATLVAGPVKKSAEVEAYERVRPMADHSGQPFEVAIATQKPRLVLIGDSILESAVSAEQLTQLSGMPCYSFAIPGSASALWYLMLKQGVIASGHHPAYVVILFRDVYLTVPEYRTNSRYRGVLNYFDRDHDPLLVELAYDPATNPVRDFLRHHWSLYQAREPARERVEQVLREKAIARILSVDESEVTDAVEKAFADEALSKELLTRAQESAGIPADQARYFDFDSQLEKSFLPHMLRLVHAAGIQLICVRLRVRRELPEVIAAEGVPEYAKELLPAYIARLQAYLDANGVPMIDFSRDERLKIEDYAAGDHLNAQLGKPLFTALLAEKLAELKLD